MARRAEIIFRADHFATRLTFMVHRPRRAQGRPCPWFEAAHYTPPRPRLARPGLRAVWRVEEGRAEYLFTSLEELAHFQAVWGQRVLPRPRQLAQAHGMAAVNGVWLSRMAKPNWPRRQAFLRWLARHDAPFRALMAELAV
ncbi:hypothetical protein FHY55_15065 [Oceanicola sp. D3]|uniref:hypothetical protein n=1 Tax=Oceanicola sp. D3 TaxID=2587163 RepID=UPI001120B4DE|nr:hypothetical protein [Oceanicola sp. D3]QDC10480.1 hypothetical protein FHY55_15065 [Oceanicola sp. D3]